LGFHPAALARPVATGPSFRDNALEFVRAHRVEENFAVVERFGRLPEHTVEVDSFEVTSSPSRVAAMGRAAGSGTSSVMSQPRRLRPRGGAPSVETIARKRPTSLRRPNRRVPRRILTAREHGLREASCRVSRRVSFPESGSRIRAGAIGVGRGSA
jgi:hypothetical protein